MELSKPLQDRIQTSNLSEELKNEVTAALSPKAPSRRPPKPSKLQTIEPTIKQTSALDVQAWPKVPSTLQAMDLPKPSKLPAVETPTIKPPPQSMDWPSAPSTAEAMDLVEPLKQLPIVPIATAMPTIELPPVSSFTISRELPVAMDVDTISVPDIDRSVRGTSVLSMEDIQAAETLEVLRNVTSPKAQARSSPRTVEKHSASSPQPEPLLSLLTSAHPLLSSAINGSMSAYTSSKSYSPRFKVGAEFVERHIGSPVANTVGSVGRRSGVEKNLRSYLERRNSSSESSVHGSKRRKVDGDLETGVPIHPLAHGDLSFAESLPAYGAATVPQYSEIDPSKILQGAQIDGHGNVSHATWQQRLMITTSGLGVAMSEESLGRLKYCLTWLRWANGHLGRTITALKNILHAWDQAQKESDEEMGHIKADVQMNEKSHDQAPTMTSTSSHPQYSSNIDAMKERIGALKNDVLQTLKQVVDVVSKYAGSALPENARSLVKKHLTTLPQRFRLANSSASANSSQSETTSSAHRILVLATEGLDMMSQVSRVVNDTIQSAEAWVEALGMKKRMEAQAAANVPVAGEVKVQVSVPVSNDVTMTGMDSTDEKKDDKDY
ncbi:MAG: hypothetical protein M1834_005151 [Cirrosporium novae-zelandiae]|nr:MAG: hypothetical protein M1834_005151 [Cirrosporium novae-zelandiae]